MALAWPVTRKVCRLLVAHSLDAHFELLHALLVKPSKWNQGRACTFRSINTSSLGAGIFAVLSAQFSVVGSELELLNIHTFFEMAPSRDHR